MTCREVAEALSPQAQERILALLEKRDSLVARVKVRLWNRGSIPEALKKIKSDSEFQDLLMQTQEHLNQMGVRFEMKEENIVVLPDSQASQLNQAALSLASHGVSLSSDLALQILKGALGSYNNTKKKLTPSFESLLRGRTDRTYVHEGGHYFMYRPDQFNFFRPLLGRFKPVAQSGLKSEFYVKGFSLQEVLTHARDIRVLVGELKRSSTETVRKELLEQLAIKVEKLRFFAKVIRSFKGTVLKSRSEFKNAEWSYELNWAQIEQASTRFEIRKDYEYLLQISDLVLTALEGLSKKSEIWSSQQLNEMGEIRSQIYSVLIKRSEEFEIETP